MSWVIESAVAPSSRTQSTISSLITSAMIGSSPVVGSSKNRISGWWRSRGRGRPASACRPRARPAYRSATSGRKPDRAQGLDRRAPWPRRAVHASRASRPKATFSQTGRLSNRARALEQHAELGAHAAHAPGATAPTTSCAVDLDRAASGSSDAEDALDQHRLAGARAADHDQRLARRRRRGRRRPAPAWRRSACRGRGSRIFGRLAGSVIRLKNSSVTT